MTTKEDLSAFIERSEPPFIRSILPTGVYDDFLVMLLDDENLDLASPDARRYIYDCAMGFVDMLREISDIDRVTNEMMNDIAFGELDDN